MIYCNHDIFLTCLKPWRAKLWKRLLEELSSYNHTREKCRCSWRKGSKKEFLEQGQEKPLFRNMAANRTIKQTSFDLETRHQGTKWWTEIKQTFFKKPGKQCCSASLLTGPVAIPGIATEHQEQTSIMTLYIVNFWFIKAPQAEKKRKLLLIGLNGGHLCI